MATHFLDDFVRELDSQPGFEPLSCRVGEPWYNPHGDCIQFRTMDAAYFGDRIDEFLTIFRHYENDEPIGFQIKEVKALLQQPPVERLELNFEVKNEVVKKVSLSVLLLLAYQQMPIDLTRVAGYAAAFESQGHSSEVMVPVGT